LLVKAVREDLSEVEERLVLEVRKAKLLEKETGMRETLEVILRSGAYLEEYTKELLLRDSKQISSLRRDGFFLRLNPRN
jgi:hypothetical protein